MEKDIQSKQELSRKLKKALKDSDVDPEQTLREYLANKMATLLQEDLSVFDLADMLMDEGFKPYPIKWSGIMNRFWKEIILQDYYPISQWDLNHAIKKVIEWVQSC